MSDAQIVDTAVPSRGEESSSRGSIARSAGIIGLGNVASRVLGLVRESVIAAFFGTSPVANAFVVASQVPTLIYDLLIGGLLSSALVPVFSEYASRDDDNASLWQLASTFITMVAVLLAGLTVLVFLFAPQIALIMVPGYSEELRAATATLIRFISPSIFFFGLSGVFTGLLFALKRFHFAAFAAAIYNLGIIIGAVFLSRAFEGDARIIGLALGIFLGSVLQLSLLLPDLRDAKLFLQLRAFWRDPGVRRIVKLYVPIGVSVVVASIGVILDRELASSTEAHQTITWMRYATTLIQFPLGLVAAAVSLAVLPDLSRFSALDDMRGYRRTLQTGLRMVLVLIVPATVGLFVLAPPIVSLLFERGEFVAHDTFWTARALRVYLLGLTFAAIDQVLIIAFYARQNTLTPAVVGIGAIGIYLVVALPLLEPLQMLGLVFANSVQHFSHAIIMLVLLQRHLGGLTGGGMHRMVPRVLLASLGMGAMVWLTTLAAGSLQPGFVGKLLAVLIPALVGLATYALFVLLLQIEEAQELMRLVLRRIRPS
ncbi:MAG: murein biosynthesis integral membrane protein MurJ [Chloroflexota bacterium]|nr:murein biosynthesis integral membrane protein MurJ [Chloroflexota bacterium]